jgi:PAS domain S-box-containing protein
LNDRYRRLTDLMELTGMLRARITGVSIEQICERFDVSRRTAERMLAALRDRFHEIESDLRDGQKYWSIPREGALTALELPSEIVMLSQCVAELEADAVGRNAGADPLEKIADEVMARSTVGVFVLDSDFQVIWVNHAIQTYFGFSAEDVVGMDKRKLIHDRIRRIFEEPEAFEQRVLATYDDNSYIEHFECHVLANGSRKERWLEHWSQPIESGTFAGGRIEHYVDITWLDQRRFEATGSHDIAAADPLRSIREELAALDTIARDALSSGEYAEAALGQISRMAQRIQRTTGAALRQRTGDAPDSDSNLD